MLLRGLWLLCDDGVIRPVIHGEVADEHGKPTRTPFLIDSAADRTVLSADILQSLGASKAAMPSQKLAGVGGVVHSVTVEVKIAFQHDDPGQVVFRGRFAAFTEVENLDMSVLGRDILNLFAVIIDRPGDTVCLLGQNHHYTIGKR